MDCYSIFRKRTRPTRVVARIPFAKGQKWKVHTGLTNLFSFRHSKKPEKKEEMYLIWLYVINTTVKSFIQFFSLSLPPAIIINQYYV